MRNASFRFREQLSGSERKREMQNKKEKKISERKNGKDKETSFQSVSRRP